MTVFKRREMAWAKVCSVNVEYRYIGGLEEHMLGIDSQVKIRSRCELFSPEGLLTANQSIERRMHFALCHWPHCRSATLLTLLTASQFSRFQLQSHPRYSGTWIQNKVQACNPSA